MPDLGDHSSFEIVKGLYMGDPGAGKTGSLASLVKAGYKLRIYDFDNLLGSLAQYIRKDCPENMSNVKFQTFTDKFKASDMPVAMVGGNATVQGFTDGTPKAYVEGLKQLTRWRAGDEDLGEPAKWGADTVVVIDSLTSCAQAAYRYAQAMNPMAKEGRTHYFTAQQLVMNLLYLLASKDFATNVLVLAHIDYDKDHLGITKGFPRSIGSAINATISANFNCVLMCESQGSGTSVKRVIRTNSTGIVELKNPVSFKLPDSLPIETGLATFFKEVVGK